MKTKMIIAEGIVFAILFTTISSLFILAVKNIGEQLSEEEPA